MTHSGRDFPATAAAAATCAALPVQGQGLAAAKTAGPAQIAALFDGLPGDPGWRIIVPGQGGAPGFVVGSDASKQLDAREATCATSLAVDGAVFRIPSVTRPSLLPRSGASNATSVLSVHCAGAAAREPCRNADGSPDAAFNNGAPANPGWVLAGNNSSFNAVRVLEDGSIFTAGSAWYPNHSDNDFFREFWAGDNGNAMYWNWAAFNLGGDNNDAVNAVVPDSSPCTGPCSTPAQQLYLVGIADQAPYGSSYDHHVCAVMRLTKRPLDTGYAFDTNFGTDGLSTFGLGESSSLPDSICRTATRPYEGHGVTVGGELIFTSTIGGGLPGRASQFILADVDESGNVIDRSGQTPYFRYMPVAGDYNSINAMVRAPDGKLTVAGFTGSTSSGGDGGVMRFNQACDWDGNYDPDGDFGNDPYGLGRVLVILDGGSVYHDDWLSALALDNRGRIVMVGNTRQPPTDSDWLVGRLNVWDGLFRDGFDGVVPEWQPLEP